MQMAQPCRPPLGSEPSQIVEAAIGVAKREKRNNPEKAIPRKERKAAAEEKAKAQEADKAAAKSKADAKVREDAAAAKAAAT